MPRAKKDGQHLNCYIDRVLRERLEDYAEEKGQTLTMAVERLLTKALDAEEKKEDNLKKGSGVQTGCQIFSYFLFTRRKSHTKVGRSRSPEIGGKN